MQYSALFLTTSPTTALQHALSLGHHQWDVPHYPQLATWAPLQVCSQEQPCIPAVGPYVSEHQAPRLHKEKKFFLQSTKNNLTLPWDMSVSQVPLP